MPKNPEQQPLLNSEDESPFESSMRREAAILMERSLGEARENVEAHHRTMEKRKQWASLSVLVFSVSAMGGLAFFFRQNVALASIPLVGIVIALLLWPFFEKFRTLLRFSAEFEPQKVSIRASSTTEDELVRLQAELTRKQIELQIAEIEHKRNLINKADASQIESSNESGSGAHLG